MMPSATGLEYIILIYGSSSYIFDFVLGIKDIVVLTCGRHCEGQMCVDRTGVTFVC